MGVYWSPSLDCAGWSDLGIPDFPTIVDDSDDWQFPDWFGGPFPRNIVLDQDMQIIHSSINHNYDQIRSAIVSAIIHLPGNEGLEPSLNFRANTQVFPGDDSANGQFYPDVITNEAGRIHTTWIEANSTGNDILYSYSDDNGAAFSTPVQINDIAGTAFLAEGGGPRIRSRAGELFLLWTDDREGADQTEIAIAHSPDNGQTWSESTIISDQNGHQQFGDIEVGPDGRLHLIYNNWLEDGTFEGIRYAVTEPGDITFGASTLPDLTSGFGMPSTCSPPDLAVSPTGIVFIAFRNNYNNFYDHFIAQKPVGQYDFNVAAPLSYNWWNSDNCPVSGPSITVTSDYVGAGYQVEDPADTYVRWGSPYSLVFNEAQNVTAEETAYNQNFPDVVLDREYLHSVWVSDEAGSPDIYYGFSKSYETGLFGTQRVNDDPVASNTEQTHPCLWFGADNLYCVWMDYRNGPARIYFAGTSEQPQLPGDVNLDGILDILDIIVVVNFITGVLLPDELQTQLADLSGDNIIDILDVILLVNQIMNLG